MKIDVFSHILPEAYFKALEKKAKVGANFSELSPWVRANPALSQIDIRMRVMARHPDVLQVLTVAAPPLEEVVAPSDAVELAAMANDEMAELVAKYPDKFVAAVACLPLGDIDAAIKEADRAITQLNFRGVQVYTNNGGEPLDSPKFRPLYERMAKLGLPIWIHPWDSPIMGTPTRDYPDAVRNWVPRPCRAAFGWEFEMSVAMMRLVLAGVFEDYPNIKFITHHCGGMVPFFERRIHVGYEVEQFHKFYNDTAVYGNTAALMCGYAFFGADHLLFGTDAPLGTVRQGYGNTLGTIRSIERMDVPEVDKDKIFEGNAMRLLRLLV
ncbi:MAG: amidohydrolase family protein [Chloroflexi bacterium]|nr:amidohydrolase family protein [Chloroflexota bacterium]